MGRLVVRVQPGSRLRGSSGKSPGRFVGWYGDLPKLQVAALAVDGAANEAAIAAVAELVGVKRGAVRLVGGAASRTKRFEIDGLDDATIIERVRELLVAP